MTATAHAETVLILDENALAEMRARDAYLDNPLPSTFQTDETFGFAKGDSVQMKRCRSRRITGIVVRQVSASLVEVFWPDVRAVITTPARSLRKIVMKERRA